MTPERCHEVKRLLRLALALPDEARSAFLAEACAGDDELKTEVEELIGRHGTAESPVESSGSTDRPDAVATDRGAT